MSDFDGFVPITAIFFATFHPTEGPKVLHQVPEGAIVPTSTNDSSALSEPLFDFNSIKSYIIPKPQLCDRLITVKIGNYRVCGYPCVIHSSLYARNTYTFNFCFVFPYSSDSGAYESSIRRLGKMFTALEEQSRYLSMQQYVKEEELGKSKLLSLGNIIQQVFQDLNNYSECFIPIDSSNNIDIKLFPIYPPPPKLQPFHVPISTVRLESLIDVNWDPTMEKIVPYINGINSIRRIADLADTDYNLTCQCIQHLVHYGTILIVDIFQFSNIYAPTSNIGAFLYDDQIAKECQAYVVAPSPLANLPTKTSTTEDDKKSITSINSRRSSSMINPLSHSGGVSISPTHLSTSQPGNNSGASGTSGSSIKRTLTLPSKVTLFFLYRSLHQSLTVKEWYIEHKKELENIDVRRFLSFGVIKGLIYRVHSYPLVETIPNKVGPTKEPDEESICRSENSFKIQSHPAMLQRSFTLGTVPYASNIVTTTSGKSKYSKSSTVKFSQSPSSSHYDGSTNTTPEEDEKRRKLEIKALKMSKQMKNFDAICTELQLPKKEVEKLLSNIGDWILINC